MSNVRMLQISDDDHLAIACSLGRMRAVADLLCRLDEDGEVSKEIGLLKHTIYNASESILNQIDAANKLLDNVEPEKRAA